MSSPEVSPLTNQPTLSNALQLYNLSQPASPLGITGGHQRFIIATKTDSLSSGFPYHPRLHDLRVTMDEWHLFTSDILNAGKLTAQEDYAAWSTGVITGTLSTGLILIFGPVVGYYAGKQVHKKVVVSKVKERLLQNGDMRSVLRRWNEQTFSHKGFQAWLELPVMGDEVPMEFHQGKRTKKEKAIARKEKRRFKIVIIPEDDKRGVFWSNARGSNPALNIGPFVEAPTTEMKTPVEMETGNPDNIQPLVNHQVAIDSEGDRKYEYRPVVPEMRPDCDATTEGPNAENTLSAAGEVSDGRTPVSEIIPSDEKKNVNSGYPANAFEMDSGRTISRTER